MPVHTHAMILLNDTFSMIIGGQNDPTINTASAITFYYDHQINQWLNGPALIQARDSHAVGIITDENTMEKLLIVTGGVSYGVLIYATEILIENQWNLGKKDCEEKGEVDFLTYHNCRPYSTNTIKIACNGTIRIWSGTVWRCQ